jgi:hypothetical protein
VDVSSCDALAIPAPGVLQVSMSVKRRAFSAAPLACLPNRSLRDHRPNFDDAASIAYFASWKALFHHCPRKGLGAVLSRSDRQSIPFTLGLEFPVAERAPANVKN